MNHADSLELIKNDLLTDNPCPELARGANQLVFGEGNSDADIVIIGEAPGRQEDISGLPFVGASGNFLDEMLQLIHLDRCDVYITNIVKYRPPRNRDPSANEKTTFLPYLVRQLNVIKPKLIVTLGRHSMEYFLPNEKISMCHGQPRPINLANGAKKLESQIGLLNKELIVLPLYHPAAALYNGKLRETLKDDFKKIPHILINIEKYIQ